MMRRSAPAAWISPEYSPREASRSSRGVGVKSANRWGGLISLAWLYAIELAIAAVAIIGFARLAREVGEGELHSLNVRVLRVLYDHRTPSLDALAVGLSRLGDPAGTTVVGSLGVLVLWFHRRFL